MGLRDIGQTIWGGERERERERDTERKTERERDRETDRDRQTETEERKRASHRETEHIQEKILLGTTQFTDQIMNKSAL